MTKNRDNDPLNPSGQQPPLDTVLIEEIGSIDHRLIAIVRFLARRAAERDFARAVTIQKKETKASEASESHS